MIHMVPYNTRRLLQLNPNDLLQRERFASWCLQNLWYDPNLLRRIVFSDEYVRYVSGIANNKIARFRGTKNPRLVQEHKLNSDKITVSWGVYSNGVLDPYFVDNETVKGAIF